VDEVNTKAQCRLVEIAVRHHLILAYPGKHHLTTPLDICQWRPLVAADELSTGGYITHSWKVFHSILTAFPCDLAHWRLFQHAELHLSPVDFN
jgi:hypothetical protein